MKTSIQSLREQLPKRERRMARGGVEVRAEADAAKIALRIPYNRRSETIFGFTEIIKPSAFTKTLQERGLDVLALWNHNSDLPLGRRSKRTLEVTNGDDALDAVVTLDRQITWHDSAYRSIERGDVEGSSFGFETMRDNWITEENGDILRELVEVRLYELSPTPFPAYPDSDAESRSARAVFDVASARAGCDLSSLAAALLRVEDGKLAATDAAEIRALVERLSGMLPTVQTPAPAPTLITVRERELAQRLRRAGIAA